MGIVPTADDKGYFLVGSDGGVFAFGDAPLRESLPGLGIHMKDIVGIVPTADDKGYFLVGSDGGVFAFGDAGFEDSLPGLGVHVNDIMGIAVNATGRVLAGRRRWLGVRPGQRPVPRRPRRSERHADRRHRRHPHGQRLLASRQERLGLHLQRQVLRLTAGAQRVGRQCRGHRAHP